jgi:hypothetical protein
MSNVMPHASAGAVITRSPGVSASRMRHKAAPGGAHNTGRGPGIQTPGGPNGTEYITAQVVRIPNVWTPRIAAQWF